MSITIKSSILLMLFFFISIGCSQKKSPEQLLISAEQYLQNENQESAVIELKNLLKMNPEHAKARIMLGKIYLSTGNAASAEKEFLRAEELSADPNQFYVGYARALFLLSKPEDIQFLETDLLSDEIARSGVLYYKGIAAYQLEDPSEAARIFSESSELDSESVFSHLSGSYNLILQNKIEEALLSVNKALTAYPESLDAMSLKTRLLSNLKSYDEAINVFEQYVELQPGDLGSLLNLANAYVKNLQFEQAEEIADKLLKVAPYNALLNQIKGVSRYHHQDFEAAGSYLDKAIQNNYNTAETLVLAGVSEYQLKNYEKALNHLIKIEEGLRNSHPAKKLLAIIRIKLGYNNEVGDVSNALKEAAENDVPLLNIASYELLKAGDSKTAGVLLNKSINLKSNNTDDLLRQGMLRLTMQDIEGISDIESVLKMEPDNEVANLVLASAYLANGQYDKALELSKILQKNGNIAGFNLEGAVYVRLKELEKAEVAFSSALEKDQKNTPSLMFFSRKALSEKNTDAAIMHLSVLLAAKPEDLPALALNYSAHKQKGDTKPAMSRMKELVDKKPKDMRLRLHYAKLLTADKKPKQVIKLLTIDGIEQNNITDSYYWLALGDSYLAEKQMDMAMATFDDWTNKYPEERQAWLKKISVSDAVQDYVSALKTVQQALAGAINDKPLRQIEIYYLIKIGDFERANNNLKSYFPTKDEKNSAAVLALLGQVQLGLKEFKSANHTLIALYKKSPTFRIIGLVYDSFIGMKMRSEGDDFLINHLKIFPRNTYAMTMLAESKKNDDPAKAIELYQSMINISPNNLLAINNLAYLMYQQNMLEEASSIVQKGISIDPNSSTLLDTAAIIQEKLGNSDSAKLLSKKAYMLAPENKTIEKNFKRINNAA